MVLDESQAKLEAIFRQFQVEGTFQRAEPFGTGHINTTFKVITAETHSPNYLLQRINQDVFSRSDYVQQNIVKITSHLKNKESRFSEKSFEMTNLCPVPSKNGLYWHVNEDENKDYWRVYHFVENSHFFDIPQNLLQIYEGGKAFGRFQKQLIDFPINELHITIPQFHDLHYRLIQFEAILTQDLYHRAKNIINEIDFIKYYSPKIGEVQAALDSGAVPLRVTHNDTKFNNILFNAHDQAICVVDLDTVMPGLILHDFGDAIRSLANTAPEDETNITNVGISLERMQAFTKGFLTEVGDQLTSEERHLLPLSPSVMAFMLGLRFLTDYLNGDHYFATHHPLHNLQRARVQFRLLELFQECYVVFNEIINQTLDQLEKKN